MRQAEERGGVWGGVYEDETLLHRGCFLSGCVCMSSASNGRKNRPRSAGNIFQIGKPPHRDPQRRESTESTRRAQRAVADCRMVWILSSSVISIACLCSRTLHQPVHANDRC